MDAWHLPVDRKQPQYHLHSINNLGNARSSPWVHRQLHLQREKRGKHDRSERRFQDKTYVSKIGESGWESNPPRLATRPATGFEDQEAHRDLTTPKSVISCSRKWLFVKLHIRKDNRRRMALQASLSRPDNNQKSGIPAGCLATRSRT